MRIQRFIPVAILPVALLLAFAAPVEAQPAARGADRRPAPSGVAPPDGEPIGEEPRPGRLEDYEPEFGTQRAPRTLRHGDALRIPPQVLRYDREADEFVYGGGAATRSPRRPGGEAAWYGTRLNRFRYAGPPGTGGLYEALQWYYYDELRLNPKKYQYRLP